MMKKYFQKKILDAKFSRLGEGIVLGTKKSERSLIPSEDYTPSNRASTSADKSKAAEAAISRLSAKPSQQKSAPIDRTEMERTKEMNKFLEAEELAKRFAVKVTVDDSAAGKRVLFWCPNVLDDSFTGSYKEVDAAIENYLFVEIANCPSEAATLMLIRGIESSPLPPGVDENDDSAISIQEIRDKRRQNFVKIVKNLIDYPEKEVYRRLRISNKFIADLLAIKGASEFLSACGFVEEKMVNTAEKAELKTADKIEDEFLILPATTSDQTDHLNRMLELLETAEPILPELYRDTKVFHATGSSARAFSKEELPSDFFTIPLEDLRRITDQQQKTIEEGGMLLTKALRERLRTRERRLYRFVLMRVRLPGEIILQGVFRASENLTDVRLWINDCLEDAALCYNLWGPPGSAPTVGRSLTSRVALQDMSSSLVDLGMAPCSLLTASFDDPVRKCPLRPDLLQHLQNL